jgi:hypothetical protein
MIFSELAERRVKVMRLSASQLFAMGSCRKHSGKGFLDAGRSTVFHPLSHPCPPFLRVLRAMSPSLISAKEPDSRLKAPLAPSEIFVQ